MDDEKKRRLEREAWTALARFLIYGVAWPVAVFYAIFRKFTPDFAFETNAAVILAGLGFAAFMWRQR